MISRSGFWEVVSPVRRSPAMILGAFAGGIMETKVWAPTLGIVASACSFSEAGLYVRDDPYWARPAYQLHGTAWAAGAEDVSQPV